MDAATLDVTPVPSTETAPPAPAGTPNTDVASFTEAERSEWLRTGEPPTKPAPSPGAKLAGADTDQTQAESSPATGKAEPPRDQHGRFAQEPKQDQGEEWKPEKAEAQERWAKLLDERRALQARVAELEARNGATRTSPPKPAKSTTEAKPEVKRPERPKQDAFENWEAYETALDKYYEDLADFKADQKLAAFREQTRQAAERLHAESQQTREARHYAELRKQALAVHSDYDTVTARAYQVIDPGGDGSGNPAFNYLADVPEAAELLYRLGSDIEDLQRIAALSPAQALREIVRIHDKLTTAPEPKTAEPAKPPISRAPARISEVGGRGTPPPDPIAAAEKAGDFETYKRLMDEREKAASR